MGIVDMLVIDEVDGYQFPVLVKLESDAQLMFFPVRSIGNEVGIGKSANCGILPKPRIVVIELPRIGLLAFAYLKTDQTAFIVGIRITIVHIISKNLY